MAVVSTLPDFKRALLAEIAALTIASDLSAAPPNVQTAYVRPPADRMRSECVFWGELARANDGERRLKAGRQLRHVTWDLELFISSEIISDPAAAEARAFEISGAVESFLAEFAQPAEWLVQPVPTGCLSVVLSGIDAELNTSPDGYQASEIKMELTMQERLS